MLSHSICADYVIIGAGILGLSVARELVQVHPHANIVIVEKEKQVGLHASGRNSGVLHAGIYYKNDSLKAKFCLQGSRLLAAYCDEYHLPIARTGKLILPGKKADDPALQALYQRAVVNGASVHLLDAGELRKLEPEVDGNIASAIFSPQTAVVDPTAILSHLHQHLSQAGVRFLFNAGCSDIHVKDKQLRAGKQLISYGHLFNTAGLHADIIAKACGVDERYSMIPFKGLYYELKPNSSIRINHLLYPLPEMNIPFLGIHFTKSITGKIYVGPTAIPALGREHYQGLRGIKLMEAANTLSTLAGQYWHNRQGFRTYTHAEIFRFIKSSFVKSARTLVPRLQAHDFIRSEKVGIRAQLFDHVNKELVMDFMVRNTENETHVLNAVSPAFTSAFSFSRFIVKEALHTKPVTDLVC
ncbi:MULTISPECIES: L-2-hydroxyglutarate oxidase [Legionella]|uniref:L-2-hydroxyglutarate oxidase n=1 Tax=Legionella septentrionalis TaxID=2498109 RepID=A0A3S0XGU8_9GAMM|nr:MULTISPECIES: L-2-hydroxyglutarate oxidase [Legionella]MCP0914343.1 L-2-hydroxyglutarate oxidase [Legionella sp. 27cVA30]RUQ88996.1 L-2-hydroxyglutarate oxidase [Legionella septentrionalis]RUR00303.1 L-2-hydroxyglutarate oxidase [Legionella septentrionalis]RUR11840.1 L-2-hydroxyglutarate oxidase [Legionella septentrionalis]RUR17527.1 L-2-hydroxyglutarate oxidase [Legionella septentrionalis]